MIEVVTSRNALLYRDALGAMFQLRHGHREEGGELERLRNADGWQTDRFDTADAIYLLLTDDDGSVRGGARLLPTMGPHLFSEVVPELCAVRGVQHGEKILELTRACVDEAALNRAAMETARKHLMVGTFEFCVRAGYEKFTTLMPTDILFRQLVIGIDIKPLGLATENDGMKQVAVEVTADQNALDALRLALDVFEPLVHYVGAPEDDPLFLAPARIPAYVLDAAQ